MDDDILQTITAKSDQLNAADLIAAPITVKVLAVKVTPNSRDQPVSIQIDGNHQPFKPCLTVRRILAKLWGPSSSGWIGHSFTLYCDEGVIWAGEPAGGIRVSHVTGIQEEAKVVTRASKHKTMSYIILPLSVELPSYSDADIDTNYDAWTEAIKSGLTHENLIKKIKTKSTLTNEQETKINNIGVEQE